MSQSTVDAVSARHWSLLTVVSEYGTGGGSRPAVEVPPVVEVLQRQLRCR